MVTGPPMSATFLLWSSVALLTLPWLLGPRRGQPRGEVRGVLRLLWHLNRLYCHVMHGLELAVTPVVPASGPALLVANHTCGVDHMLIQAQVDRTLGFMVAEEYYNWTAVRPFAKATGAIPVKRDGRDLSAMRAALRSLKEGHVVPLFPEGKITPESGEYLGPGKPGAAYLALRAGVPIIPAYLRGTPRTDDILAALRTPSHARVTFGPPIDLSDLTSDNDRERENLAIATERLMAALRDLKDRLDAGEQPVAATLEPRRVAATAPVTAPR